MSTLIAPFANHGDLTPVMDELITQASAVLASVYVVRNVHEKYMISTESTKKSEFRLVLREHGAALETDLSIIRLNAESITDERLDEWVSDAGSAVESAARKAHLQNLTEKMVEVQEAMAGLWDGILSVDDVST